MTHIDNLENIISHGLLSHHKLKDIKFDYKKISNDNVMQRRIKKGLENYVNLYINPRNAMMYQIYKKLKWPIIVLGINGKELIDSNSTLISIGNAASNNSTILSIENIKSVYELISDIRSIKDWNIDKKSKKLNEYVKNYTPNEYQSNITLKVFLQSEVLVKERISSHLIKTIYVPDENLKSSVEKIVKKLNFKAEIVLDKNMFFEPVEILNLTENISIIYGDMFTSECELLTISVNTVGIMGKGLASRFKYMYPEVYVEYEDLCKSKEIDIGKPFIYISDKFKKKFLLFPTKKHWRELSKKDYIERGLDWFIKNHTNYKIKSAAFPALGCGLGGLKWEEIGPLMVKKLNGLECKIEIYLHENYEDSYFKEDFYNL